MNKVFLNASREEEIQQLCNKFEEWRKEKKSIGTRIPEELWLETIKLAEKYSVCQVSKRLRLGYMDLKKRMRDMNAGDREAISESRETGGFLELKVSSPPFTMGRGSMTPCIMEIMRSDGAQIGTILMGCDGRHLSRLYENSRWGKTILECLLFSFLTIHVKG